jgi:hypothetical protein
MKDASRSRISINPWAYVLANSKAKLSVTLFERLFSRNCLPNPILGEMMIFISFKAN